MKREIIFRGKRVDNGEWVTGDLIHGQGSKYGRMYILPQSHIYPKGCNELDGWDVIPETVGQYTGLKDKNGVEIFEGDVVKWDDCSDGRYWRIAVVQLNPDIQFDCSLISRYGKIENSSQHIFRFGNFIYKDTHNHLYVLGNVHDNSELIK